MSTSVSRVPRLYVDHALTADAVRLFGDQARYLRSVLRLKSGDPVVLFNGRGLERSAVVQDLTRQSADLSVTRTIEPMPEPTLELTLIHALTKADAMDLIVQKATELGVRHIRPVFTRYSVVKLSGERTVQRLQHWERVARSACEQCGRHFPPSIEAPQPLNEGLARVSPHHLKLVLHADCERDIQTLDGQPIGISLLIGPEGGLSDQEVNDALAAGFTPVSLGPRVLRTETAALVGCALAQARWGDLKG